jgi:hypothetical protein
MRDEAWTTAIYDQNKNIFHELFGSILSGILHDGYAIRILDNNYLWVLYHFGYVGLAGFIIFIFKTLVDISSSSKARYRDLTLLLFAYILGCSISRDEFFVYTSLIFFFSLGLSYGSIGTSNTIKNRRPNHFTLI